MSSSLNKVILIGNLGKDPEIRSTGEGKEIATFSIATSETWRDKATNEKKEKTEWHRVVVFSEGLVGIIKQYVKKGTKVYLEGSLQTRKWVDSSGVEKYTTEIVLQSYSAIMKILDSRNSSGNEYSASLDGLKSSAPTFEHSETDDDEVPF